MINLKTLHVGPW